METRPQPPNRQPIPHSGISGDQIPVYKKISGTFKIDRQKYFGTGIASSDFIYLVISGRRNDLAAGIAGALGGLVGGLLLAVLTRNDSSADLLRTCYLAEIDDCVGNHPDWPLRITEKNGKYPVLIIPREDVGIINHPSFTNLLELQFDGLPFAIEYLTSRGASVRDFLLATQWPVKWKGENLSRHLILESAHPSFEKGRSTRWWIAFTAVMAFVFTITAAFALPRLIPDAKPIAKTNNANAPVRFAREPRPATAKKLPKAVPTVLSIDQALELVGSWRKEESTAACTFLGKTENFDPERQAEVHRALMTPYHVAIISDEAASALRQWVLREDIPALKEMIVKAKNGRARKQLLKVYTDVVGVEAAPLLAEHIDKGGRPLLEKIGPEAATSVVPYLNSYNNSERLIARELLSEWKCDGNLLLRQCLDDIDDRYARLFMLDFSGQIDKELQNEIAAKIETLLEDKGDSDTVRLVKLLGKYPGTNTDRALVDLMKSYKKTPKLDSVVVKALANIDSEVAVAGEVFAFLDGRAASTTRASLMSRDPSTVAKLMVAKLDDVPRYSRRKVAKLLSELDGAMPVLIDKCVLELGSSDHNRIKTGMSLLANCKYDSSIQSVVSAAMLNAMKSVPNSTESYTLFREIGAASVVWSDNAVASRLVGYLDSPSSKVRSQVLYTLLKMEQPAAFSAIVRQAFDGEKEQQRMAQTFISRHVSAFEPALLSQLDDPAFATHRKSQLVLRYLQRAGGKKSLEVLAKHVAKSKDPSTIKSMKAVIRSIDKRQQAAVAE